MQLSENAIKAAISAAIKEMNLPTEEKQVVQIKIEGEAVVRRGQDYQQVIDHTIPYSAILALALSKLNGVTVASLMRETLEAIEDGSMEATEKALKENAKEALKELKGTALRNCSGKVTFEKGSISGKAEGTFCQIC